MRMGESPQELLLSLKTVVEGLLSSQVAYVWNIYGGLRRLHCVLEKIFKHECNVFKPNGEEDCWVFIQGLSWLRPILATSPTPVSVNSPPHHTHTDQAMIWLHNSLETHSLSEKLSWLVSDGPHLASCYNPNAFLRQPQYAEAALICLRAIEHNQLSLLTEIHPSLYLSKQSLRAQEKFHRRCSSYPDSMQRIMWNHGHPTKGGNVSPSRNLSTELSTILAESGGSGSASQITESSLISRGESPVKSIPRVHLLLREKPWKSLPCLTSSGSVITGGPDGSKNSQSEPRSVPLSRRSECKTEPSSPAILWNRNSHNTLNNFSTVTPKKSVLRLSPSVLKIDYKEPPCSGGSGGHKGPSSGSGSGRRPPPPRARRAKRNAGIQELPLNGFPRRILNSQSGSVEEGNQGSCEMSRLSVKREVDREKRSFIEDGGTTVQPMSTGGCYFPKPSQGQSLTSFLSSNHFAQPNAELDRENAHFNISEAIIAAIEQVKCNKWEELGEEESDDEIEELKQRIRLRRKQKQQERHRNLLQTLHTSPMSKTDTTTDQSCSPLSSSCSGSSESLSTDGVEDMEVDEITPTNLENINKSGLSLSMASLYSEADLSKRGQAGGGGGGGNLNNADFVSSAESVALCLLSKFRDKHLPRASDITWLVSEKDAPQQLLPMPNSWVVDDEMREATQLRGTSHWAPPRPQIIFTTHPTPQRRLLMEKQDLRCAGCGMKVAPEYAHRFRYCEYLGRYFCTGCHSNLQAFIPAKILAKWDFNKYPVSNFSFKLLEHISSDPLFSVADLNSLLYKRVRILDRTRQLRLQLYYIKDFILTCRFATKSKEELQKEPDYIFTDPEMYSVNDFVQIRSGELTQRLNKIVVQATKHIAECELCGARGFMCELCRSSDIIYPWQLGKVTRCAKCGACYHSSCHKNCVSCPRCHRISTRTSAIKS